jgi:secreted trypsin-like serine protease
MTTTRHRLVRALGLVTSVLALGTLTATTANSITGGTDAWEDPLTRIITNGRSCTGTLVAPQWVVTSASCFATDPGNPGSVVPGPPARPATAYVEMRHSDKAEGAVGTKSFNGYEMNVTYLVPRSDRDLVLAKLDSKLTTVTPAPLAQAAPAQGEALTVMGWGRSTDEWVPVEAKQGTMAVTSVATTTIAIDGASSICKGDSGGPAYRTVGDTYQLVAIHSRSWQHGCFAEAETRTGAVEARVDNIADWIRTTAK